MKYLAISVAGFIMFMSSVWIGAYGMYAYPYPDHWQNLPIFLTSLVFFLAGLFLVGFGFIQFEYRQKRK